MSIKLNNGTLIPALGFGFFETPKAEAEKITSIALKTGYRHFDTAHFYENEAEIVSAIAKFIKETNTDRKDIYYTTKVRQFEQGYEGIKASIKDRLALAKPIGYIDLLLIHAPHGTDEQRHGTWRALQEAVDEGKVKSIGVSNYGIKHIKQLLEYPDLKYKPVVNQIELHPWLCRPNLVKFCESNNIKLQAYSPLVRGFRFGEPILVELSKKYGVTEAQILIKWSLQRGFITLPKSATESRIISNFNTDFELSKEDVDALSAKDEYGLAHPTWVPVNYPIDAEK